MTQFASTLYPQTNPTNPVLLWARESGVEHVLDELNFSSGSYLVGAWNGMVQVRVAHVLHARRVLERLAALSG